MSKYLIALILVLVAVASSSCQEGEPDDRFIKNLKIVWASEEDWPVGFDRTHEALKIMLEEMNSASYKDGVEKEPKLREVKRKVSTYLDVCEFDKSKCLTIFYALDEIMQYESENSVNLMPYIKECQKRQEEFCTGRKSGEQKENGAEKFFKKVLKVCWPASESKKD